MILPSEGANLSVVPTGRGGDVVAHADRVLEELIEESEDHAERTRMRRTLSRLTDLGTGAAAGTASGLIVRVLMGS